ncbi:unnamed protein product, partial [Rotaria sp. Silwood2]
MIIIKQLLCQLFSGRCRLKSLRLDISNEFTSGDIHKCLVGNSYFSSNFIVNQCESCCMTLRRLFIRLKYTFFLENLIEHVPNLEEMSVQFEYSLNFDSLWELNIETSSQSNENWFNK